MQPGPGGKQWFRVSLFAFRPGSRDPTNLRAFASGARLQSADCDAYVFSRMQASTSADCNRDPAVNNGFGFRCSSLDPTAEAQRTSLHVPPESACSQRTLRLTWHRSSAWVLEGSLAGYFVCRGLKDYSFVRLFVCSFVRLFGARGSPRGLKNNSFVRLFVCDSSGVSGWVYDVRDAKIHGIWSDMISETEGLPTCTRLPATGAALRL